MPRLFVTTLSLTLAAGTSALAADLPPLPKGTTSLGVALADGTVYTYGGNTGAAHRYSTESQSGEFRALDLSRPNGWKDLPGGPKLQGLALVAHGGKVYRLGGFTAMNAEGAEHDLRSQAGVAVFDPKAGAWENLTPLPEPRSSFDAAVLGDRVYVVGGWSLHDGQQEGWHDTAWSADLTRRPLVWESVPSPPFKRRALALAEHAGKLYALGGMTPEGPTRRVDVFDPKTGTWAQGPDLAGERPIDGFGPAARAVDGRLYVSSLAGTLQRLSEDGSTWEVVRTLDRPRFFHQMIPHDGALLFVGGGNMTDGRFTEIDVVPLPQ